MRSSPVQAAHPARDEARRAGRVIARGLYVAPGTAVWFGVLVTTTGILRGMSPSAQHAFLVSRSTNLDNLVSDPLHVLLASAFWTDEPALLHYFLGFLAFSAITEWWLGTRRWFTVAVAGHIGATLVSVGVLDGVIQLGLADASLRGTVDVGVSYALSATAAVLAYAIRKGPWRATYLVASLAPKLVALGASRTFADVGHVAAFCIGLAFVGFARDRPTWNPNVTLAWLVRAIPPRGKVVGCRQEGSTWIRVTPNTRTRSENASGESKVRSAAYNGWSRPTSTASTSSPRSPPPRKHFRRSPSRCSKTTSGTA